MAAAIYALIRTDHKQWIVPWDNLTNNANWFFAGIGEIATVDWNRFTNMLITPAGIVAEYGGATMNIHDSLGIWFT